MSCVPVGNGRVRRLRDSRLFLYGLIGGMASAIDVGLFVALHELAGLPPLAAHTVSIPTAAFCSFLANATINFRTTDRLLNRAISFALVVTLGYALGAFVILLFAEHSSLGANVGKVVSLPLVFALQFTLNSRISFRARRA